MVKLTEIEAAKKAERIANKARTCISEFCYEECNAYCCRKGYLILTEKEQILSAYAIKNNDNPLLKSLLFISLTYSLLTIISVIFRIKSRL